MTTPVKTFGEYIVCFDAENEEISARYLFTQECGWTEKEYARIRNYAWFCARVSLWKNGEELGAEYLGCCSYRTESAFYTRYEGDYFADMVRTLAHETKNAELIASVHAWHEKLRAKTDARIAKRQQATGEGA